MATGRDDKGLRLLVELYCLANGIREEGRRNDLYELVDCAFLAGQADGVRLIANAASTSPPGTVQ